MIEPVWVQPRITPLFRGGLSLSAYKNQILLMGLFQSLPNYVSKAKEIQLSIYAQKQIEPDAFDIPFSMIQVGTQRDVILQFKGDNDHFARLFPWRDFILQELRDMTRKYWLRKVDRYSEIPIALNVRRAKDFPDPINPMGVGIPTS